MELHFSSPVAMQGAIAPDIVKKSGRDTSKYSQIYRENNDLKELEEIANKWVGRRCYPTIERASVGLVRGDIHE